MPGIILCMKEQATYMYEPLHNKGSTIPNSLPHEKEILGVS